MQKHRVICDCCKSSIEMDFTGLPKGFKTIQLKWNGQYNYKNIDLCAACQLKLGLVKETGEEFPVSSIQDRLLEVVMEIVQEAIENQ